MESSSTILSLSQLSFFPPKPNRINSNNNPSWPWKQRASVPTRLHCGKMDGLGGGGTNRPQDFEILARFGEASPEAKSAKHIHNFFTYVAVKIVTAQLESYNPEAYEELMEFLSRNSLNDGDHFIASLMRESSRHKTLALRILEVRSAYCKRDFEWDNMKRLAFKMVDESNTRIMRDYVLETSHGDNE